MSLLKYAPAKDREVINLTNAHVPVGYSEGNPLFFKFLFLVSLTAKLFIYLCSTFYSCIMKYKSDMLDRDGSTRLVNLVGLSNNICKSYENMHIMQFRIISHRSLLLLSPVVFFLILLKKI